MKSLLDRSFLYTPVKDQGPSYLREKFARIRAEQAAHAAQSAGKVQAIPTRAQFGARHEHKSI